MNKQKQKQELQLHIGETVDDMGHRFVDAWHRAETSRNAERHVGFANFEIKSGDRNARFAPFRSTRLILRVGGASHRIRIRPGTQQ